MKTFMTSICCLTNPLSSNVSSFGRVTALALWKAGVLAWIMHQIKWKLAKVKYCLLNSIDADVLEKKPGISI